MALARRTLNSNNHHHHPINEGARHARQINPFWEIGENILIFSPYSFFCFIIRSPLLLTAGCLFSSLLNHRVNSRFLLIVFVLPTCTVAAFQGATTRFPDLTLPTTHCIATTRIRQYVVQHCGYLEIGASAEHRATLWHTLMAYLRQSLHHGDGLPCAGLCLRAPRDAHVDVEADGCYDYRILHYNLWGQGVNAKPSGVQAELAVYDPQLLPYEHQRHLISSLH
jgi:hypothetical protein